MSDVPVAAPAAPVAAEPSADVSAPETEVKTAAEKFLIKVNGKMREASRDEVIRMAQKAEASRENFEKSAALTRKNQAILKALQDPEAREEALKQLGVDPDELAERRLARRMQEAQMTPEQRQFAEREAELQRRERAIQEQQQSYEQAQAAAQEKQLWSQMEAEYTTEIDRAIKSGDLAGFKPAEVLYHMANEAELNAEYGLQLSPAELIQEAKSKIAEGRVQFNEMARNLEGDALLSAIEPDVLNKILKAAVGRYKGGQPIQQLQKPAQIAPSQEQDKPKWIRPGDLRTPFI